uniref:Uncharacterized protein n=1 Tax=Cucumis melo TaxID=3656 RepID=A0A9I9EHT3_CUCME
MKRQHVLQFNTLPIQILIDKFQNHMAWEHFQISLSAYTPIDVVSQLYVVKVTAYSVVLTIDHT